jgi:hypothetical protein
MGMFDIVMEQLAEVSWGDGCVWYIHEKTCRSQSWTDFTTFLHDYVKHTPLQLTSAGFSITISNTLTASTDFGRFFHEYIKHTHRLDWLQQVAPWLYQTYPSSWLTSAGFSMTISNTFTASTDFSRCFYVSRSDGCVWYSHGKTCWSPSKRWVCLI